MVLLFVGYAHGWCGIWMFGYALCVFSVMGRIFGGLPVGVVCSNRELYAVHLCGLKRYIPCVLYSIGWFLC